MLEESDTNGDGLIQFEEFKEAFLTAEEFMEKEEEYREIFDNIASYDEELSSISFDDIENAISEYEAKINEESAASGGSSGGYGGYSGQNSTQQNTNNTLSSADLTKKDLPELKQERADVLNNLNTIKNEQTQALTSANAEVNTTQAAYNEKTALLADIVRTQAESEENTNEYSQNVIIYEDLKVALNSQITNQESTISQTNSLISSINGKLSSLSEPPQTREYYDEETGETIIQDNPDYAQYLAQKAALEDELASAQSDLASQESALESLQSELTQTEASLEQSIQAWAQVEQQNQRLTEQESTIISQINDAKTAYDTALQNKNSINSQYKNTIDNLQESLSQYNDTIKEKETAMPEGYHVQDGKITNGEYNLIGISEDNLPEGYKVEDGIIKDKDNNEVGILAQDDEGEELYLYDEIEPEPLGFSDKYLIARLLFENSINPDEASQQNLWGNVPFNEIPSDNMQEIQKLYDEFVSEHNDNLKSGEQKADSFMDEASKQEEIYDTISASIERAQGKIEIKPDNFASYLEDKNIDVLNATQDEMNNLLNDFMTDKYGEYTYAKYNPELSEEKLQEYLGESDFSAFKDYTESQMQEKIEEIVNNDKLSPWEQMSILNSLKSYDNTIQGYVENYFAQDDSYFYDKLNEMMNDNTYSSADLAEFVKQYKNLDNKSSALNENMKPQDLQTILELYESIENQDDLLTLNNSLSSIAIANLVLNSGDEAEISKYIPVLFKADSLNMAQPDGSLSTDPNEWGIDNQEEAASLNETYLNTDASIQDKTQKILDDLNNGTIDKQSARYLMSTLFEGDIQNIQDISNSDTVLEVFSLFKGKMSQQKDVFSADSEFTTQYIQKDGQMPYLLIGPKEVDPDEELPVIVYMHGQGSCGQGEYGVTRVGPGNILPNWDLENFNGYVICPSLTGVGTDSWDNKKVEGYLRGILDDFQSDHNVNSDQIFVGGHSLGAMGAVYMAKNMDDVFSKAFVLSGYNRTTYNISDVNIPIIGFVASGDDSASKRYMNGAFAKAVGNENVITVSGGHNNVPPEVFNMDNDGNNRSDLFEWLFEEN